VKLRCGVHMRKLVQIILSRMETKKVSFTNDDVPTTNLFIEREDELSSFGDSEKLMNRVEQEGFVVCHVLDLASQCICRI